MITIVTLGDAVIDANGSRITPVAVKKFALLLILGASGGATTPKATLHELLFPGLDERKAQHSLRELVYQLRQLGIVIDSDGHGLSMDKATVRIDWMDVVAGARVAPGVLRDMQRGLLPNYAPSLSSAFSHWLDAWRVQASLELVKVCLRDITHAKDSGDWKTAELAARACLALDPLNGHATIALAEVLAITGSAMQAASVLDAFANELGPEARRFAVPVQALRRKIAEGLNRRYARSTFPFAGRETEMQLLSRMLEEAKHRGPRAVLLVGEPGIGKSRIAAEFAARADLEGCAVVRVGAHPYDKQRPMGAFIDVVRLLQKQPGALGCSPESMFWLHTLIGAKQSPDEARPPLSNEETAHAVTRAIVDLIGAVAVEASVVIVIDDIQWTDRNSLAVLRDLVLDCEPRGVLLILTSRDERAVFEPGDWGDHLIACPINALDREVAVALLSSELRSVAGGDPELAEWMADIANGHPFYADNLLAHYRTTGERFVVPPQLNAMVDRRIRAISPEARDVLETIVALGKHATIDRIEKVLDRYGMSLMRHTRELGDARLIIGDREVAPAHWLITESVQRNIVPLSERLLYRRIAAVLEGELTTQGDSGELWECAQAWVAAGEPDHAADMIASCAEHARAIGRANEASDLYFRAGGMASAERSERFAEASIRAAVSGADPAAILRAVPMLTSRTGACIHDDIELAELRARILCDVDFAKTLRALQTCLESEQPEHRLAAARALLSFSADGRLVVLAIDAAESIATLLDATCDFDNPIWLQCAAVFHSAFANLPQLRNVTRRLVEIAAGARPDVEADLLKVAAVTLYRVGDADTARLLLTRAQSVALSAGLTRSAAGLALTLASICLDAGDYDMACKWFEQLGTPTGSDSNPASQFLFWSWMAVAGEFAIFENDRERLHAVCERFADLSGEDLGYRTMRSRVIFSSLLKHLRGEHQEPRQLIDSLTVEQVPGYETGIIGDLEMTTLIAILRDSGHPSLAAEEFRKYVVDRRRPFIALSANLTRAAASVGMANRTDMPALFVAR